MNNRTLRIILFPIALFVFLLEYKKYREVIKALHNKVNSDEVFFNFIDKMNFSVDWVGRLWSIQIVKDPNVDEDVAWEVMSRTLLPFRESFEMTGLVDVIVLDIIKVEDNTFLCLLEPYNFDDMKDKLKDAGISAILTAVLALIASYIYFI